jgi:hypothetical protein
MEIEKYERANYLDLIRRGAGRMERTGLLSKQIFMK